MARSTRFPVLRWVSAVAYLSRPRFHPTDGHLYVCGMFAWAGNQTAHGGFYRVRYTGRPTCPSV